jgi:hypothetical protein
MDLIPGFAIRRFVLVRHSIHEVKKVSGAAHKINLFVYTTIEKQYITICAYVMVDSMLPQGNKNCAKRTKNLRFVLPFGVQSGRTRCAERVEGLILWAGVSPPASQWVTRH